MAFTKRAQLWAFFAIGAFAAVSACSSTPQEHLSPTGPSATGSDGASAATSSVAGTAGANSTSAAGGGSVRLPAETNHPSDVSFPPRNEPLLFRQALEAQYRDVLGRGTVDTFVDQEGTVVWTQEYLRYRVNLCSHAEAVFRVFRQIDGFGVQPICGSTSSVIFPPRNEPFDFMIQLESKYRDGLGRPAAPSYVDVEGNIVWTQEYLRYRVTGCPHFDAQQRVFDQIAGRGVQPTCGGGGGDRFLTGEIGPLDALHALVTMNATGQYQATLRWDDPSIDLDLYLATPECTTYPPASCVVAASDGVGVNTEQIFFFVANGDEFRLWIDNFTDRPTSFVVEHFVVPQDGRRMSAGASSLQKVPRIGPKLKH